jgi:hypothetical protein
MLGSSEIPSQGIPRIFSMLGAREGNLLHLAARDNTSDMADVTAKVQYICDQCPAVIHLRDNEVITALHTWLSSDAKLNFKCVRILCDMD